MFSGRIIAGAIVVLVAVSTLSRGHPTHRDLFEEDGITDDNYLPEVYGDDEEYGQALQKRFMLGLGVPRKLNVKKFFLGLGVPRKTRFRQ